jgi:hypothetical protein
MDIIRLYNDYSVPHAEEGASKNAAAGWVQVQCPWCDDPSDHLGYNIKKNYYHCWRCGFHHTIETIAKLLSISKDGAALLYHQYGGKSIVGVKDITAPKMEKLKFMLPVGAMTMSTRHREYLLKRNFDPEKLEREWGLLGTGPIGYMPVGPNEEINYKFRIIAPIYWHRQIVSFQGRSIKRFPKERYMACPTSREHIFHKHILYGLQQHWRSTGICVEGITDVWRLGPSAFATFGIEYTREQVREIEKNFKRVAIIFDSEHQAQHQATKLIQELRFRGVHAMRIKIADDPASLSQDEANALVKEIMGDKT